MIETASRPTPESSRAARVRGRRRWRRVDVALSVGLGAVALTGALYLGVTGPLTSPVAPPVAAAAPAAAPAAVAPAAGTAAGTTAGQATTAQAGAPDHDGDHLTGFHRHGGGGGR